MVSISESGSKRLGGVFTDEVKTVIVHDGSRGPQGTPGPEGPEGPPGDSINVLGRWVSGTEYCPNDAVSWRSSVVNHVYSLYVQRESWPCSVSSTEPHLNPQRWVEIGAVDWDNAFGGIWEVAQPAHGFTEIGTPVAFNGAVYTKAAAGGSPALGVVREIWDAGRFTMQSTGEVPLIEDTVIDPPASTWQPGKTYYVSSVPGRVTLDAPIGLNTVQPILMPTDGAQNGVVLPWVPSTYSKAAPQLVGYDKFFFDTVDGQQQVVGADKYGNVLEVYPEHSHVFLNGVNLEDFVDYTVATDGSTVSFTDPMTDGDIVEIWTPSSIPDQFVVPSTVVKVDDIEPQFDGQTTRFAIEVANIPAVYTATSNLLVWLDATNQELLIDYVVVEDPAGFLSIEFAVAPDPDTRFWAILFDPSSGGGGGGGDCCPPFIFSDTAPPMDTQRFWMDTDSWELHIPYDSGGGNYAWVEVNRSGSGTTPGGGTGAGDIIIFADAPPPVEPQKLWMDTLNWELHVPYENGTGIFVWAEVHKTGSSGGAGGTPGISEIYIYSDTVPPVEAEKIWIETSTWKMHIPYLDSVGAAVWVEQNRSGSGPLTGGGGITPPFGLPYEVWQTDPTGAFARWSPEIECGAF